jgi:N4-(beta-N-acetylglucosaminyl)-L-asparaginase
VLVVGEGALAFARANGFSEENLLSDKARRIWLHWRRTHSDTDDWRPPSPAEVDVQAWFDQHYRPPYRPPVADSRGSAKSEPQPIIQVSEKVQKIIDQGGTVHVSALDGSGNLGCVTSTSGHPFKLSGRVGDSPILGAGLYADSSAGTCGSIGHGEANLQNLSSFLTVELMRSAAHGGRGFDPEQAGLEALQRIAASVPQEERDESGRPRWNVTLFILAPDGRSAGVSLWGPREYAVADAQGGRLLPCKSLWT